MSRTVRTTRTADAPAPAEPPATTTAVVDGLVADALKALELGIAFKHQDAPRVPPRKESR